MDQPDYLVGLKSMFGLPNWHGTRALLIASVSAVPKRPPVEEALRDTVYYGYYSDPSDPDTRSDSLNSMAHVDYMQTGWLISDQEAADVSDGFEIL